MNVDKETLKQLLSSMNDYNSVANHFAELVAKGIMPVALIILGVLWFMDFTDTKRHFSNGDAGIGFEFWIQSSMKYIIGMMLVAFGPMIIDAILYLVNTAGHIINLIPLDAVTNENNMSVPTLIF